MRGGDSVAAKVLGSDPAFVWVMVLDEKGELLETAYAKSYSSPVKIKQETKDRLVALDAISLQSFSQAEKWYGKLDFILLAYGKTKVLLMYSRSQRVYLAMKIPRTALAERLFRKVNAVVQGR